MANGVSNCLWSWAETGQPDGPYEGQGLWNVGSDASRTRPRLAWGAYHRFARSLGAASSAAMRWPVVASREDVDELITSTDPADWVILIEYRVDEVVLVSSDPKPWAHAVPAARWAYLVCFDPTGPVTRSATIRLGSSSLPISGALIPTIPSDLTLSGGGVDELVEPTANFDALTRVSGTYTFTLSAGDDPVLLVSETRLMAFEVS